MAWTTPKTDWEVGELVSPGDLNAVSENLAELDRVRKTVAAHTTTADIVTPNTNNTFDDIDSDNLNLTITTTGGDVLIHFHGPFTRGVVIIDVEVDGTRRGDTNNGMMTTDNSQWHFVSFTRLIQGLNAGSHTFKLQTKRGTTLRAGAQFWVREI